MSRSLTYVALCVLALAAPACRTSVSEQRRIAVSQGAFIKRTPKEWYVVHAAHRGPIGFMRLDDVTEGGGPTYPIRYVFDKDWRELGMVNQFGGALKWHYYTPSEQAQQNETLRADPLPSDSLSANVLRMFDIDPSTDELTFPVADRADILGDKAMPLAGPGVVPAKAPVK